MSDLQTFNVDGIGLCALIDGNLVPINASGDAPPKKARGTAKKAKTVEIPSVTVNVKDYGRVRLEQVYAYGKDKPEPFKSHGGFRVRVTSFDGDGAVMRNAKAVNLTAGIITAIRDLSDKDANALMKDARS